MILLELTSEEVTARRRAERKQFKLDRARAILAVAEEAETIFATEGRVVQPALSGPAIPSAATWKPSTQPVVEESVPHIPQEDGSPEDEEPLLDVEHLQLTLQEAFFLMWKLDCLTVLDSNSVCFFFPSQCFLDAHHPEVRTDESARSLARFSKGWFTSCDTRLPATVTSIRQPIPRQLCRLSPLPFAWMGGERWH
jgi:hypothetical protein